VGSCVPVFLVAYYIITWKLYLGNADSPNGIFGMGGSRTVFYSWFILAVVGIDLSEYGLLGAEAGMLMTTFWGARDAWHVVLHGDHSWSGPDGWIEAVRYNLSGVARDRLWWVLAAPSILLFVTLSLLGLSMELQLGFRKTSEALIMMGRNGTNFNDRSRQATLAAVHSTWSLAAPPRVPGFGIVSGKQTSAPNDTIFLHLSLRDNTLLEDADVVFLAPQSDAPFTGKVWGMVVRYPCKVVLELNDFTILSRRNGSMPLNDSMAPYDVGADRIEVYYQSMNCSSRTNYAAVAELGYSGGAYDDAFFRSQNATQCYFNKSEGATELYPGLTKHSTLEMALCQTATDNNTLVCPPLDPPAGTTSRWTLGQPKV
jgi:hypothetical protein